MSDSSAHIVKSAQRVLKVIEFFTEERPAASVTDISRALSYPQSSTSVLLRCLRQLGYLYYDRAHRTYRLTARAALLGCWSERGNYRGGRTLDWLDAVAAQTGETVVLSAAHADYALHHLHVRGGTSPRAIAVDAGAVEPIMHNVQGELQLASYPDPHIRLALHRLNSEEANPDKRVNVAEKLAEFQVMRDRGWGIGRHAGVEGASAVAAMVPRHKGGDRIVISLVAADDVIERSGAEFLRIVLEERDRQFASAQLDGERRKSRPACGLGTAVNGAAAMRSAIRSREAP
jgi:DNA-binding IclR family transcriptional regulator